MLDYLLYWSCIGEELAIPSFSFIYGCFVKDSLPFLLVHILAFPIIDLFTIEKNIFVCIKI